LVSSQLRRRFVVPDAKITRDAFHLGILGQLRSFEILWEFDAELRRDGIQPMENAGRLLLRQEIDLKIEVISPLGALVHGVLADQDERRQKHGFEGEDSRQEREWVRIEANGP
jgi:hypothetical protein